MTVVAAQHGLQERTLRRRLAVENSSYGAIADDVRGKLAIEYLQTMRMSVDDVAWQVGFRGPGVRHQCETSAHSSCTLVMPSRW